MTKLFSCFKYRVISQLEVSPKGGDCGPAVGRVSPLHSPSSTRTCDWREGETPRQQHSRPKTPGSLLALGLSRGHRRNHNLASSARNSRRERRDQTVPFTCKLRVTGSLPRGQLLPCCQRATSPLRKKSCECTLASQRPPLSLSLRGRLQAPASVLGRQSNSEKPVPCQQPPRHDQQYLSHRVGPNCPVLVETEKKLQKPTPARSTSSSEFSANATQHSPSSTKLQQTRHPTSLGGN